MCGFAGLLHRAPVGAERMRAHVTRMATALRHRGPDDEGTWVDPSGQVGLGFRRLSIIDLSPAGHQPMVSPSGRLVIVFNGEVYNFQDIRQDLLREGVTFRGGSDTEVILAGMDRWGVPATLRRMIGMFAIALWDTEREELTLIRDRMGVKPLYVARTREGVAFGSELGALTEAPGFERALDPQAIEAYLRYLFVPGPRTPFGSVAKLPPGHSLRIPMRALDGALPEPEPFWSLAGARRAGISAEVAGRPTDPQLAARKVDELDALLADAVRLRMIADVPLGALLSGGIDSSLVVALMARQSARPVRTFTIGFDDPEHDESAPARAVAEHVGAEHTALTVTGDDALALVPEVPSIFDEPLADPSQLPTYLVSRLARRDVTVALCGDGGDELFAGYNRYISGRPLFSRLGRLPWAARRLVGPAVRAVPPSTWDRAYGWWKDGAAGERLIGQKAHKLGRMLAAHRAGDMYRTLLSNWDEPGRFMRAEPGAWDPIRADLPSRGDVTLQDMLAVDQRYYLPDDLLQKVDRASMAVSLEVRVPILDHRVVELSWTLPDDLKVRGRTGKWILRQVLDRHVPRALVDRPKTGFSVPLSGWLAGPLRPWAEELLLGASPVRDALFDRGEVARVWRGFLGGRTELALGIWALVVFEAWRGHWRIEDLREAA